MRGKLRHPSGLAPSPVSHASTAGPARLVTAAPALPTPKMPSAVPCHFIGNHTEVYAMPTANPVPARPKPRLASAKSRKELA